MDLYSGGLTWIIGRIFASEIWGVYFWEGLYIYIYIFFWGGGVSDFYSILQDVFIGITIKCISNGPPLPPTPHSVLLQVIY